MDHLKTWLDDERDVTVRLSSAADGPTLVRLAALSSGHPLAGETLVAQVGDELWAATELATGRTISDPFRATAAIRSLLDVRRSHILAARKTLGAQPRRRLLEWRLGTR
jgi:hypothetical protein